MMTKNFKNVSFKGSKIVQQVGMQIIKQPKVPTYLRLILPTMVRNSAFQSEVFIVALNF